MARCAFYSFHYTPDCSRAAQVRNMGVVDGTQPASDNDWEKITKAGDEAIKNWIENQMKGCSCAVVLVGAETAGRKWINHEIAQAWNKRMGVVGVHIHNLKNLEGVQSRKGANPFDWITHTPTKWPLSNLAKCYDPPFWDSKQVYGFIKENLPNWIEEAIAIRAQNA